MNNERLLLPLSSDFTITALNCVFARLFTSPVEAKNSRNKFCTNKLKHGVPYWLYKYCASQLSNVMTKLINYSIGQSYVPLCWRTAHVTPVPKSTIISQPSDLRPISVTSLFSRLTEKMVVRDYLLPCLNSHLFKDQYAYKPTGSTTCALIDFSHRIHTMLETSKYVRCVFLDFSKAFDLVDHSILIQKLITLQVPNFVIKWIVSFLSNRTQAVKLNFKVSSSANINRSVIQGSGLGPILFIIYAFDLKCLDLANYLLKYADDCTLLNPELANTSLELEMINVLDWAKINKMLINFIKTKYMVLHRPNPRNFMPPPELDNIQRVNAFRLLGLILHPEFKISEHVCNILTTCNQRLYLLAQLKKQGLGPTERDIIFQSIVLSKILYALPMYFGYLTEQMKSQINAIFHKAKRWQLIEKEYSLEQIAETLQIELFVQSKTGYHCLNHLYEPRHFDPEGIVLRNRGHGYNIPPIKYAFNRLSFVSRCLYNYR